MPRKTRKGENNMGDDVTSYLRKAAYAFSALVLFLAITSSVVTIPQGHVGVVFDRMRHGVLPETLGQGWHMRLPVAQTVTAYPVSLRTYSDIGSGESQNPDNSLVDLPTVENQHIQQAITVVYNVQPDKAFQVYNEFRGADIQTIEETFIRKNVISAAGIITGGYSIMDIAGAKKGEVQDKILQALKSELEPKGFTIDSVNLGQAVFPKAIEDSLQQKVQAQQVAEAAKYRLLQAETDAKAKIATAEGEARQNQLIQASITPKLVHLRAIEKWDGHLPQFSLGNATPILDLRNVTSKDDE